MEYPEAQELLKERGFKQSNIHLAPGCNNEIWRKIFTLSHKGCNTVRVIATAFVEDSLKDSKFTIEEGRDVYLFSPSFLTLELNPEKSFNTLVAIGYSNMKGIQGNFRFRNVYVEGKERVKKYLDRDTSSHWEFIDNEAVYSEKRRPVVANQLFPRLTTSHSDLRRMDKALDFLIRSRNAF